MAEVINTYTPTIWRNEVTPVDQDKMNNMENQLVNSQKGENILTGLINPERLPVATNSVRGATKLSDSISNGSGISGTAATPKAIYDLKMNCAIIDPKYGDSRVALKATTADKLQEDITINLTTGVTGTISFNKGGTYSVKATVIPSEHIHTYEQISSYANNATPGLVYAFSSPADVPAQLRNYDIPNISYLRGVQTALRQEILTNTGNITTNKNKINSILSLASDVVLPTTSLGQWKASFDSVVDWKENDFVNFSNETKQSIQDTKGELVLVNKDLSVKGQQIQTLKETDATLLLQITKNAEDIVALKKLSDSVTKLETAILNIADYLRITEEDLYAPRPIVK